MEKTHDTRDGYNLAAPHYDTWKWQQFWHLNEYPHIMEWCNSLPAGRGLDIGAGSGNSIGCFLRSGHKITAIDISSEMLRICRQKYKSEIGNGDLDCIEADIREVLPGAREYDWILSNRTLSHIEDVESIFKKMAALIKIGGTCFISDIHPLHCYKATNISIGDEHIFIETYKHAVCDIKALLAKYGFHIQCFEEVHAGEVIDKDILQKFQRLTDQQTPIFYYLIARYDGL